MNKEKTEFIEAKNKFYNPIFSGLIIIACIHLLPKPVGFFNLIRFFYTIVYFICLIIITLSLIKPRSNYCYKKYALRFKNCSDQMETNYKHYLLSMDTLINNFAFTFLFFLGSCYLVILNYWIGIFSQFSILISIAWWISFIAVICSPVIYKIKIIDFLQKKKSLKEALTISKFKPKNNLEIEKALSCKVSNELVISKNETFSAGGLEWQWDDFYKNCIIFGQSGSGKTVCVLNTLLEALIGSKTTEYQKSSGLILDPKGDFNNKIKKVCKKYGRENDLVIIDPFNMQESIKWNPFDTDEDELELADRFAAVLENVGLKNNATSFWIDNAKKFIRYSISLIRLTNPADKPPDLAQINELAGSFRAIANRTDKLNIYDNECDLSLDFFADEWAEASDKIRSGIQSTLTNMIFPFLGEPYRSLFSGKSTIKISDIIDSGKILYVHMPVADKEAMAKTIGTFIKLEYFREVLKRIKKRRPSFFFCDEFQSFFTSAKNKGDSDFFERSRQSSHANIISTQNIYGLLKQSETEEPVMNLLGNCALKMFLRNTDYKTNEYASTLFGKEYTSVISCNKGQKFESIKKFKLGALAQIGHNVSYQYELRYKPEKFPELKTPSYGRGENYCEMLASLASRSKIKSHELKWKVNPL